MQRCQLAAGGGIVAFDLAGGKEAAWRVIDATRMLSITANLGDAKTTITHPATTTHQRLSEEARAALTAAEDQLDKTVFHSPIDGVVIERAVDQGQTVFLISWRNPDEDSPDKSFDDYMLEGPLQALEVIEADYCDEGKTSGPDAQGNEWRMGVRVNRWGRPLKYAFRTTHPGDIANARGGEVIEVPADQIIHLFTTERPGQTRGVPWAASAVKRLHHLSGYEEAEVVRARANSSMASS